MEVKERLPIIKKSLEFLYSPEDAQNAYEEIKALIDDYKTRVKSIPYKMSEKDVILILYGDQVFHEGETALATLNRFLTEYVEECINTIHILPFFTYSSDDGFSIVDYKGVCPLKGSWKDIEVLRKRHRLMFDGVINHMSQLSGWFNKYLENDPQYRNFFIDVDPSTNLSDVVRPRTSPLLSDFKDINGMVRYIWTTFSRDQVDLNYSNYKVLVRVLDVLLFYVEKGASLIRLDAIAFIWKEIGTACVHLPQTHELIQLMRKVIHEVAPEVFIITETNVPHEENVSYFGRGDNEAQMVYNFALPPLLAFSILKGDTSKLTAWAQTLQLPSDKVCFFNFTGSHDGVGVRAVSDILTDSELDFLINSCLKHGGLVSYRAVGKEEKLPYEMNCSYIDLLTDPQEDDEVRIKRMLLSQAVKLAMPGVPGIYIHSLVGSRNYHEAARKTRINRSINREKLNFDNIKEQLDEEGSLRKKLFNRYKQMISIRIREQAFNPFAGFEFLEMDSEIFAIKRFNKETGDFILALHNFSANKKEIDISGLAEKSMENILTRKLYKPGSMTMEGFDVLWLKELF